MNLYLIRHAESYGNIKGKIISTTDFELKEKQIAAYCSSLARARQTLSEILRCAGREDVSITESSCLKEMDLGYLEGMSWEERRQKYPQIDLDERLSFIFFYPARMKTSII